MLKKTQIDNVEFSYCKICTVQYNKSMVIFFRCTHAIYDTLESIEWFIEDQAFSPSYDLAPCSLPPPPSATCLSFSVFLCVADGAYWRESGVGWGANSYDGEKAWYSINHSILPRKKITANPVTKYGYVKFQKDYWYLDTEMKIWHFFLHETCINGKEYRMEITL